MNDNGTNSKQSGMVELAIVVGMLTVFFVLRQVLGFG
jgi:hypothetical protein